MGGTSRWVSRWDYGMCVPSLCDYASPLIFATAVGGEAPKTRQLILEEEDKVVACLLLDNRLHRGIRILFPPRIPIP
jgi:hypothetical protein